MKNALLFGIEYEAGVTNSMACPLGLDLKDKVAVRELMKRSFDIYFDAIFVIQNGKDGPDVSEHFEYPWQQD